MDTVQLEWRGIKDAWEHYVSNQGDVANNRKGKMRILKQSTTSRSTGDPTVTIDGRQRMVSKLVWETFVGKVDRKHVVRHRDGNKTNNHLENLYLCSKLEISSYRGTGVIFVDNKTGEARYFKNINEASEVLGITRHNLWANMYNREDKAPVGGRVIFAAANKDEKERKRYVQEICSIGA